MTQPGHQPSKDWLAFVKTSRARNKIKHVINASERAEGHRDRPEVSGKGGPPPGRAAEHASRKADLESVAAEYGYGKIEDLYAALGYGKFSARQVLQQSWRPDKVQGRAADGKAAGRAEPEPPRRAGRRARPPARWRRRHQGARRGRPAGLSRQVLQPHPRRGHRRLRHARQGRGRAFHAVPQRAEPDVRRGAQDRSGMGARRRGRLPGAHRGPHRRPPGHAESAHQRALRREHQHPQPGGQDRYRTRTAAWWR